MNAHTEPVNVLLVDDRPENLLALRAVFDDEGYALWEARSGEEALKHLLKAEFAVIVLDVQMPGMNGYDTARFIKAREKTRHVPIIFVTAIDKHDSYIFQGYEAGCVDYMFKPFDPRILRSKVAAFVELYRHKRELKAQAEALRLANERLLELDQAKDAFLSVISHELRTPLNFIMGFASILDDELEGTLSPAQRQAVSRILVGADRMEDLVTDLVDYAKIKAGKLHLTPVSAPYAALVEEVLDPIRALAAQKGVAFGADIQAEGSLLVDRKRIAQVLRHLVVNAVKFTPEGGRVAVRVFCRDDRLITQVSDTGIGIPAEALGQIFDGFTQVDMTSTRERGGTGLGLAISKALVEAHGGTLDVDSTPGEGSVFSFSLPMAPGAAAC
jgi:signal transduction histidine kinase